MIFPNAELYLLYVFPGECLFSGERVGLHTTFCIWDVKKRIKHVADMWGTFVRQRTQARCDLSQSRVLLTEVESLDQGTHLWGMLTGCPKSGCHLPLSHTAVFSQPQAWPAEPRSSPSNPRASCWLPVPTAATAVRYHFPGNSSHPTMHWAQEPWYLFFCLLPLFALCFGV